MKPRVAKGFAKSSKKKQRLYENISKNIYLKKHTTENEKIYKTFKSLFESIKKKSKKLCYSEKLLKLQGNAKQIWKVMKEIIGTFKLQHTSYLLQKVTVNK